MTESKDNVLILASEFVKRQTRTSEFSYYNGSWEDVEALAVDNFHRREEGYRDGVTLIPVPADDFYTSIISNDFVVAYDIVTEARREGETPVRKTVSYGRKRPAKYVELVLYRKDVLEEDNLDRDKLTGADFQLPLSQGERIVPNRKVGTYG